MHRLSGEFSVRVEFRNYAMNFLFSRNMQKLKANCSDFDVFDFLVVNLKDFS